ncbi:MAG: hypothetical protein AAF978_06580, partial [Cyanobacteria bacterium P01_E01_bin.48]
DGHGEPRVRADAFAAVHTQLTRRSAGIFQCTGERTRLSVLRHPESTEWPATFLPAIDADCRRT